MGSALTRAAAPSRTRGADVVCRGGRLSDPTTRLAYREYRNAPPAAAGRTFAGIPRLLRPARGELLDDHGTAHQRRLRLHLDADQRAARRETHAHRGGVRRGPALVP